MNENKYEKLQDEAMRNFKKSQAIRQPLKETLLHFIETNQPIIVQKQINYFTNMLMKGHDSAHYALGTDKIPPGTELHYIEYVEKERAWVFEDLNGKTYEIYTDEQVQLPKEVIYNRGFIELLENTNILDATLERLKKSQQN